MIVSEGVGSSGHSVGTMSFGTHYKCWPAGRIYHCIRTIFLFFYLFIYFFW